MSDKAAPLSIQVSVSRDANVRFFRKWEITAYSVNDKGEKVLVDRRRMFGWFLFLSFERRLKRKIKRIQHMQEHVHKALSSFS